MFNRLTRQTESNLKRQEVRAPDTAGEEDACWFPGNNTWETTARITRPPNDNRADRNKESERTSLHPVIFKTDLKSAPTCQIPGGERLCSDQRSPGSPVGKISK